MVLEKTLKDPLDSKEIKPINPKGNQSLTFVGRTDAKTEVSILWLPDAKTWLIGKAPEKDWRQEEKGKPEDKMVGWHHRPDGHESEQAPRVGDGQGSLVCCSPWGHKELDMTEQLNWGAIIVNNNWLSIQISFYYKNVLYYTCIYYKETIQYTFLKIWFLN